MDKNERIGLIFGIAGSALGATLWLVILGVIIKSTLLIVLPIIVGALCIYATIKFYNIQPNKKSSIFGLAIIWLIFWNMLLCNLYFDKIPQSVGAMTTGKTLFSLIQINVMFLIFFLIGCGLIIRDIVKK